MEMQNPGAMQRILSALTNGQPYILLQAETWLTISCKMSFYAAIAWHIQRQFALLLSFYMSQVFF